MTDRRRDTHKTMPAKRPLCSARFKLPFPGAVIAQHEREETDKNFRQSVKVTSIRVCPAPRSNLREIIYTTRSHTHGHCVWHKNAGNDSSFIYLVAARKWLQVLPPPGRAHQDKWVTIKILASHGYVHSLKLMVMLQCGKVCFMALKKGIRAAAACHFPTAHCEAT